MKLYTIFLNALLATKFAKSSAVSPSSDFTSLSPDQSHQSLLREGPAILDHLRQKLTPHLAPSRRSPPNAARDNNDDDDDDDNDYQSAYAEAQALGLSGGFRTTPTTPTQRRHFNIAHGTLMALTFTLWLPLGALVMHTTRRARLHAALQSVAYASAVAGLGLGIWLGRNVRYLDYAHTVIGMAVMGALVFQLALGWWTHWGVVARRESEKEKMEMEMERPGGGDGRAAAAAAAVGRVSRLRGWVFSRGFVHRWLGRGLIALGIINGGLGLKLAQNTRGGEIAYGIVAGIVGTAYLSLLLLRTWKRYRMAKEEPMAPQGGMLA